MIDVASRSKNGVTVPDRKATRAYIIELFKKNMASLKERLVCILILFTRVRTLIIF